MRPLTPAALNPKPAAAGIIALSLLLAACSSSHVASRFTGFGGGGDRASDGEPTGHYKVGEPYRINGVWYYPEEDYDYDEKGIASWYGPGFHGEVTANGERYDQNSMSAAHPTLQLPSVVRVTNLENGLSVVVRVNDRGPFANGRLIDMSARSAELLGFKEEGTARVRVQILPEESLAEVRLIQGDDRTPAPAAVVLASAGGGIDPDSVPLPPPMVRPAAEVPLPPPIPPRPPRAVEVASVAPLAVGIYVQAGTFTVYDNARSLRTRLAPIASAAISTAVVDGTEYYRVRLGPLATVEEADMVLATLIRQGQRDARIILD